jgi:molecular chaperone GrpE
MTRKKRKPEAAGITGNQPDAALAAKIPAVKVIDRRFWVRETEGTPADGASVDLDLKPTYVQELEQKMARMEEKFREKAAQFEEEARRIQERLTREMERRLEEEKGRLAQDLLEVLDNLEIALEACRQEADVDQVRQGVMLVRDGFQKKMERLGLQPLGQVGDRFDPHYHEAVEMRAVSHPSEDGTIVAVWQKGYSSADRLVRPARVSVGRCESIREVHPDGPAACESEQSSDFS